MVKTEHLHAIMQMAKTLNGSFHVIFFHYEFHFGTSPFLQLIASIKYFFHWCFEFWNYIMFSKSIKLSFLKILTDQGKFDSTWYDPMIWPTFLCTETLKDFFLHILCRFWRKTSAMDLNILQIKAQVKAYSVLWMLTNKWLI